MAVKRPPRPRTRGRARSAAAVKASSHPDVSASINVLDAWIQSQVAYRNVPSIAIGVVFDRELVWAKGFGFANVETQLAATPSTIYRMASVTKTFTATAIMQLRDAGKLHLDDPVVRHLPWFAIRNPFVDAPAITIRQLLTHTSGLPREADFPYWTDGAFPTLEQIRQTLPSQELAQAPEAGLKYSNLGLSLAGAIVAQASGVPYDVYVRDHILQPLGMRSSTLQFPVETPDHLAVGYGRRMPDGRREVRPEMRGVALTPSVNLSSTVEDLARYLTFHMSDGMVDGTRLMRASTLREMQRIQWLQDDWKSGFGFGFAISREDGRTIVGHDGSAPGHRTRIAFSPEDKLGVIALINADGEDPGYYTRQIFSALAPALRKATAPPSAANPDPSWTNLVGTYRNAWGDTAVLVVGDKLVMIDVRSDDPNESMYTLEPTGPNTFRSVAENFSSHEAAEIISFDVGPDGRSIGMRFGKTYASRLGDSAT